MSTYVHLQSAACGLQRLDIRLGLTLVGDQRHQITPLGILGIQIQPGSLEKAEKTLEAEVETAFELSNEQLQTLADALSKRLDRTVNLQQAVNPALIGGVLIRAGDVVVDGSVRGKLSQLAESLKS